MKEIAPLLAIKNLKKKYPNSIQYADMLHKDMCCWDPDLCYINVAAAQACLSSNTALTPEQYNDASLFACFATWRRNKNIYTFDQELIDTLTENAKDLVIPVDVIQNLPVSAFYIETKGWNGLFDGFMVFWEEDHETHEKELRFLYLNRNGEKFYENYIHIIPGGTILDGLERSKQMITDNIKKNQPSISFSQYNQVLKSIDDSYNLACKSMQLVLYLCADNVKIVEDPQQAAIYRQSTEIADKYREIRIWNAARHSRTHQQNKIERTTHSECGAPKKPHIRQSHWHSYWKGSGESRKLVLYWMDPMIIHEDQFDEKNDNAGKKLMN